MDQPIACTNCQTVTTNDGRTVWVCENCGVSNQPVIQPAASTPMATVAPEAPVIPESVVPDVTTAQAAISDAAAAVAPDMTPVPPAPVPPVGVTDMNSPIMGGSTPPMPPGPTVIK